MKKKQPQLYDSININGDNLVVMELFKASDTRWLRTVTKKGENRYFSEREWLILSSKKRN